MKQSTPVGYEDKAPIHEKDLLTTKEENAKKVQEEQQEQIQMPDIVTGEEKQNASERINLQHIMELREAYEKADADG
jgi:WD40 repeat protein/Ca2+-binding EF-hand superfamily protein